MYDGGVGLLERETNLDNNNVVVMVFAVVKAVLQTISYPQLQPA